MNFARGQSIDSLFLAEGNDFQPTEWGVGPWSADTLQYGALLVRALERSEAAEGMALARLSFDLWRPVTRERIASSVTVLRDGRKARTVESSLAQGASPSRAAPASS